MRVRIVTSWHTLWTGSYRSARLQNGIQCSLFMLLLTEQELAMLFQLGPQDIASPLKCLLLHAWAKVSRIGLEVSAAVEMEQSTLQNVMNWWSSDRHGGHRTG